MNKEESLEYLKLLEELEQRLKYNKFASRFPLEGKYSKDKYPKQMAFIKAGRTCSQRLLSGGNRTGKTDTGAYETAAHLTGDYPTDWEGCKFLNPIKAWGASVSLSVVKDVMQEALLGPLNDLGSGMIPKDKIVNIVKRSGSPGSIEKAFIRHKSGGISEIGFKSYEQGREDFQGTKKDWIWLDEEPNSYGIYEECLMRLMDDVTPGKLIITFTPLLGKTKLVASFLERGKFPIGGVNPEDPSKYAIQITWDDAPHMSEEQKKELIKSISPHLREARTKGLPHLGAGAIYPYSEDSIKVDPFPIPSYWPRGYALDVGWNRTAALWVALDSDSGVYYCYSEYYQGSAVAAVHASAIKARGAWIPGVIDPGSRVTNQKDGTCLYDSYCDEGLNLSLAINAVEAGIAKTQQLIESGRFKVFSSLVNWFDEFRSYMREEETGKVKDKQDDHLMDATRYIVMACPDLLEVEPDPDEYRNYKRNYSENRDDITGY